MLQTKDRSTKELPGSRLGSQRKALNLTQSGLAKLLGTRQPNISAYESGGLLPGKVLQNRIRTFERLELDSQFSKGLLETLASYATQIKAALQTGEKDRVIRLIIQISDDFHRLESETDIDFYLSEPSTTGDQKYDALLAGLAVHLARQAHSKETPGWTTRTKNYLPSFWYFGPSAQVPKMRAMAFRDAIPSMRARGVIFSRRILESI